jgi:hypothetical protein
MRLMGLRWTMGSSLVGSVGMSRWGIITSTVPGLASIEATLTTSVPPPSVASNLDFTILCCILYIRDLYNAIQ